METLGRHRLLAVAVWNFDPHFLEICVLNRSDSKLEARYASNSRQAPPLATTQYPGTARLENPLSSSRKNTPNMPAEWSAGNADLFFLCVGV